MPSLCTVFAPIRRERQSWCCWDCGLRVCRDRTSCATVVTAILQCCARFDLTTLVFEEQVLGFFFALLLPSKWIVWFNQVENASQEEKGAFFPLPPGLWAFSLWSEAISFLPFFYKSVLFEIHIFSLVGFHLLSFCCDRR